MFFKHSFVFCLFSAGIFAADMDDQSTVKVLTELITNINEMTKTLDSVDLYEYSPWQKRFHADYFYCGMTFISSQLLIVSPAIFTLIKGLDYFSNWITNCEPNGCEWTSNCQKSAALFSMSASISSLTLISYFGIPLSFWLSHKSLLNSRYAMNEKEKAVLAERERRLNHNLKSNLDRQKFILKELLKHPLIELDLRLRKVIFLNGAMIGNATLMKSVLSREHEQDILDSLEELEKEICTICRNNLLTSDIELVDQPNDVTIKTSCNHYFHKRCLQAWLKKGSKLCPICKAENHEASYIFELWINRTAAQ